MGRIYLPLQVDFDDDEKVLRLTRFGRDARGCRDLLVGMWRYCKRERSDGHVPAEVIGKLAYPDPLKIGLRDADRIVEVGLAERTDTGYYFPKYLRHNKSRAQLEADAVKKAEAGKKGGVASGEARRSEAGAKQDASSVLQPSEAKDRDKDRDNEKLFGSSSLGNRPEPLRVVPATEPTEEQDPERCTRHPNGNPTDEPCRGCQRVEERRSRRVEREQEQRRLANEEAARNCVLCEGTNIVLDPETKLPTARKCTDHRRTA
jgi:hypothetical protein